MTSDSRSSRGVRDNGADIVSAKTVVRVLSSRRRPETVAEYVVAKRRAMGIPMPWPTSNREGSSFGLFWLSGEGVDMLPGLRSGETRPLGDGDDLALEGEEGCRWVGEP